MGTLKETFRNRLRTIRAERGLTQEGMADMLGISPTGYAKIERGESDVSLTKIEEIATALQIEYTHLLPVNGNVTYVNTGTAQQIGSNTSANDPDLVAYLLKRIQDLEQKD